MRISDWSSDVCSSDLQFYLHALNRVYVALCEAGDLISVPAGTAHWFDAGPAPRFTAIRLFVSPDGWVADYTGDGIAEARSEEHTSELQSLMRISYAVFCLKKKNKNTVTYANNIS